jgi:hypothetical protein
MAVVPFGVCQTQVTQTDKPPATSCVISSSDRPVISGLAHLVHAKHEPPIATKLHFRISITRVRFAQFKVAQPRQIITYVVIYEMRCSGTATGLAEAVATLSNIPPFTLLGDPVRLARRSDGREGPRSTMNYEC